MKALLLKDWTVLWKQGKMYFFILIFFSLMGGISLNNSFMMFFSVVFMSMMTVTVMGLDEQCHFEAFAELLPIERKVRVMEKYLFGVLQVLLGVAVNCIVQGVFRRDFRVISELLPLLMTVGMIFPMLNLPFIFKVGVAKARIWYLVVMVLVMACIGGLSKLVDGGMESVVSFLNQVTIWGAFGITVVLLLISMLISMMLYERREL
jgi:ABC-2 type transport system permease protein